MVFFRGAEFCSCKDNVYIELDLTKVIELKKRFLEENKIKQSKNWHMRSGNALDNYDFCEKYFDSNKPVAVVHQGMLRFFTFDEKEIVAKNIKKLLQKHGEIWVTCDFHLRLIKKILEKKGIYSHKMDKFTNCYNLPRFDDIEHVKSFLSDFGFNVDVHKQEEVFDLLSSIKVLSPENVQKGKDFCKNVVVCVMRLND